MSARLTLPTLVLLGTPEPFSTPAALRSKSEAGGVFSLKVKDLSSKMVISAGTMSLPISLVASLNCLQNSWIFTPWGPRAVPIGGAGLALVASIWIFIIIFTFLAAIGLLLYLIFLDLQ